MPVIIDNVKVGTFIKEKLKGKNMSQDDLANYLSISKSAVSQNLSGKSSFDLQNLLMISELFDVTLDQLLTQKIDSDQIPVSEFERLARKGLSEVMTLGLDNPNIFHLDIYGKYFVEYVLALNDIELFEYLHINALIELNANSGREKDILLQIILFCIKHNSAVYPYYIGFYATVAGSFRIDDGTIEKFIWKYIEDKHQEQLILSLFYIEYMKTKRVLKFWKKTTTYHILSYHEWLEICAIYHLEFVFSIIHKPLMEHIQLSKMIGLFHQYHFYNGIKILSQTICSVPNEYEQKLGYDIQESFELLCELDFSDIIENMINSFPALIVQPGMIKAIKSNSKKVIELLYTKFANKLHFRDIGAVVASTGNHQLMSQLLNQLTTDDRNLALSFTKTDDIDMMLVLIKGGATFSRKYYNQFAEEKMNHLVHHLIKSSEE
ncbi:MAG TPA: helix-turn-helix transcriptional regulator [Bacilli bacterium]|nr:helix-turn-helix transcriptional regulator [Bacilli bacterium]